MSLKSGMNAILHLPVREPLALMRLIQQVVYERQKKKAAHQQILQRVEMRHRGKHRSKK